MTIQEVGKAIGRRIEWYHGCLNLIFSTAHEIGLIILFLTQILYFISLTSWYNTLRKAHLKSGIRSVFSAPSPLLQNLSFYSN